MIKNGLKIFTVLLLLMFYVDYITHKIIVYESLENHLKSHDATSNHLKSLKNTLNVIHLTYIYIIKYIIYIYINIHIYSIIYIYIYITLFLEIITSF